MLITPLFGTAELAIAVSERADDGGNNNDEGPQVGVAKCAGYDVCEDHMRILVAPSLNAGNAGNAGTGQTVTMPRQSTLFSHGLLTGIGNPT